MNYEFLKDSHNRAGKGAFLGLAVSDEKGPVPLPL